MSHRLLILTVLTPYTVLAHCYMNTAMAEEMSHRIEQVEKALPAHIGACVLATEHGHAVFEHAYGMADIETKTPCTPGTNFRMASVSKQFTATAAMLLVDRGQLSLDDTLGEFFPGLPDFARNVTVEHLLTHTSGLPAYEDLIPKGTTLQLNDIDVLHLVMDAKSARFTPGEKFEYSNSGYTLLGLVVEVVAEKPFHEFMLDEVLKPVGMSNSVLYQRGLNEVPHRAYGHARKADTWVRADQSVTSATRGDGAIYTSLRDYQKWLRGIEDQKLLKPESYKAMFAPHVLTDRDGAHYGYGWFVDEYRGEPRIYHNGDTQGFRLCVQLYPQQKAALLIQLNNNIDGETQKMTKVGERVADILIFNHPR